MRAARRDVLHAGTGHLAFARFDTARTPPRAEFSASAELRADLEDPAAYARTVAAALAGLAPPPRRGVSLTVICTPMPLLAKVVDIPHVAADKEAATLRHEIRQAVPYPLDDVVWDHAMVGGDALERRVALVAVRREWPEAIVAALREAGWVVAELAALPACMANAANMLDPGGGDRVLIDAGHRATHLVFMGGDHFALRTAPFGYASKAESAESHINRLGAEVARSLAAQKRQNPGYNPKRAIITRPAPTGTLDLPATLGRQLGMAVDLLHATVDEADDGGSTAGTESHAIMLGAVADEETPGFLKFDLSPNALRENRASRRRIPVLALAAGLFLAAGLLFYAGERWKHHQLSGHEATLREAAAPVHALHHRVRGLDTEVATLAAALRNLGVLAEARGNWVRFLADLQERLVRVEDVWIDGLEIRRVPPSSMEGAPVVGHGGETGPVPPLPEMEMKLNGRMLDRENPLNRVSPDMRARVGALIDDLLLAEFVSAIGERRFDTAQPGILRFEITLVIDPEHPL